MVGLKKQGSESLAFGRGCGCLSSAAANAATKMTMWRRRCIQLLFAQIKTKPSASNRNPSRLAANRIMSARPILQRISGAPGSWAERRNSVLISCTCAIRFRAQQNEVLNCCLLRARRDNRSRHDKALIKGSSRLAALLLLVSRLLGAEQMREPGKAAWK